MAESFNSVLIASNEPADDVSLLDVLDHVLNAGVVIRGSIVISIAGVDLIYLGVDIILASVETALKHVGVTSEPAKLQQQKSPKAK